jgi:hypothetical protein
MKKTLFSIIAFNFITLAIITVLETVLIHLERESIIFGQNNNITNLNSTKIDILFSTEAYNTCTLADFFLHLTIKVLCESILLLY